MSIPLVGGLWVVQPAQAPAWSEHAPQLGPWQMVHRRSVMMVVQWLQ
jgi:hypothetical protein